MTGEFESSGRILVTETLVSVDDDVRAFQVLLREVATSLQISRFGEGSFAIFSIRLPKTTQRFAVHLHGDGPIKDQRWSKSPQRKWEEEVGGVNGLYAIRYLLSIMLAGVSASTQASIW